MDAYIHLAIRSAVAFALQTISLCALLNSGGIALAAFSISNGSAAMPAFMVGAATSIIAAICGFSAMQAEQIAHIASRIPACTPTPISPAERKERLVRREKAWQLVFWLRLIAIAVVAISFGCLCVGAIKLEGL